MNMCATLHSEKALYTHLVNTLFREDSDSETQTH